MGIMQCFHFCKRTVFSDTSSSVQNYFSKNSMILFWDFCDSRCQRKKIFTREFNIFINWWRLAKEEQIWIVEFMIQQCFYD